MIESMLKLHKKASLWGLGILCLAACHDGGKHHHEEEKEEHAHGGEAGLVEMSVEEARLAGVAVQEIARAPFCRTLGVSGRITAAPGDEMKLVAATSGTVRMHGTLAPGVAVKRGQTLFTVSADRMSGGDPEKVSAVNYETAKDEYERMTELLAEKVVTQSEWNEARQRYETARIAYEATLEKAGRDGHAVVSPVAGQVVECLVMQGEYVNAGDVVAVVSAGRKVMLEADVPLRHQEMVRQCTGAFFTPEGAEVVYDTDSLHARLITSTKGMRATSAYLTIRWEMEQADGLWPGSYATVYLKGEATAEGVAVPVTAVMEEAGSLYIYIRKDSAHFEKRRIEAGYSNGSRVEVKQGLKAGERVATHGVAAIRQAGSGHVVEAHSHSH